MISGCGEYILIAKKLNLGYIFTIIEETVLFVLVYFLGYDPDRDIN